MIYKTITQQRAMIIYNAFSIVSCTFLIYIYIYMSNERIRPHVFSNTLMNIFICVQPVKMSFWESCTTKCYIFSITADIHKSTPPWSFDLNHIDGLVQDRSIPVANALKIRQSCTRASMWRPHWTPIVVMMPTLSSLAAIRVTSDDKVGTMTTLVLHWFKLNE